MNYPSRIVAALAVALCFRVAGSFAQEQALEYKYRPGDVLHYKATSHIISESGVFPTGSEEILMEQYYTLTVTAVDKERTAEATFKQDSVLAWFNKEKVSPADAEALNGVPVTIQISNRGIILDWHYPEDLEQNAVRFLEEVLKDMATDPPIPGTTLEVGETWSNDIPFYFSFGGSTVKVDGRVTSKYVRRENFRGIPSARIEYSGILQSSRGNKAGSVRGTKHLALGKGKKLSNSTDIEATLYFQAPQGAQQLRLQLSLTVEVLN